ncbi:hypothetical protein ACIA8O_26270 [Kitasatospora sp. NPDC051853]|uniref:hypothetical protein n=1 Tax=Kitasatospora sp. NPDC051853 TaxID=3364058 RepID=UPI0037AB3B70
MSTRQVLVRGAWFGAGLLGVHLLVVLGAALWSDGVPPGVGPGGLYIATGVAAGVLLRERPRYRKRAAAVCVAVAGACVVAGRAAVAPAVPDAAWGTVVGEIVGAAFALPLVMALAWHLSASAELPAGVRHRHPLWYWGPLAAAAAVVLGVLVLRR